MLVGAQLRCGRVRLEITEVEAYAGPEDTASHARFGRTDRNAPMWGRAGRLYVYLCYGVHNMVNVSTGIEGEASAVLVRSAKVVAGEGVVVERRGGRPLNPQLCAGPGKVGQALGLVRGDSGEDLCRRGGTQLWLANGGPGLVSGARVGIDFAAPRDRKRRWRFADAGSKAVTHARELKAVRGRQS